MISSSSNLWLFLNSCCEAISTMVCIFTTLGQSIMNTFATLILLKKKKKSVLQMGGAGHWHHLLLIGWLAVAGSSESSFLCSHSYRRFWFAYCLCVRSAMSSLSAELTNTLSLLLDFQSLSPNTMANTLHWDTPSILKILDYVKEN